jgi:hypothetical protein
MHSIKQPFQMKSLNDKSKIHYKVSNYRKLDFTVFFLSILTLEEKIASNNFFSYLSPRIPVIKEKECPQFSQQNIIRVYLFQVGSFSFEIKSLKFLYLPVEKNLLCV